MKALQAALAKLTHAGRMRYMAAYGRAALDADRPGRARREILAALERGNVFERAMALQSCYGSRDGAHVLRAFGDPSRKLRGLAETLAPLVCDDVQLLQALRLTPRRGRADALRIVARSGRQSVVDLHLAELEAVSDPAFATLLPLGSQAFVGPRFDQAAAEAGAIAWHRLARRHPRMAADHLLQEIAAGAGFDPRRAQRAQAALPHIIDHNPDLALDLLAELAGHVSLTTLPLEALARRRPRRLTDLILSRPNDGATPAVLAILAARLAGDDPMLGVLVARFPALGANALGAMTWLRRLPANGRRAVFAVAARGWRDEHGALPPDLIALLPGPEREAEARRNWDLPIHQTRPSQQLRYAGCLPFDEAMGRVATHSRAPDAELRTGALAALTQSARYTRSSLGDLLAVIQSRGNEQDPVRLGMLGALASLPPSIFAGDALAQLTAIMRQALDAIDLSPATAQAMERLVIRLMPLQPEWAVAALGTLMRERGALTACHRPAPLTDRDIRRLAPVVWPVIQAWATREREHQIVAFAGLIDHRLAGWVDLVDLLAIVVATSPNLSVSQRALQLIAWRDPDRLAVLVPALLRLDASWITQSVVQDYLHTRRQDLLDPFLGAKAWKGRFSTGKTRLVLPFRSGFERWLPRQQLAFAETLGQVIADADRDSPAVLTAVDQLAAVSAVPVDRLVALADLRNPRVATRDRALQALARRDAGDGLDGLLAALGDARARVAVYALRTALRELPEHRVAPLLRAAPRDRVTVLKEVVRLAGEQPGDDAYLFLLELDADRLHRDARIALLRALWDHLERPSTWPILERAAADPDPAVAISLARIAAPHLSQQADDRLCALLAELLGRPEPAVRLAVLARAGLNLADSKDRLGAPILRSLNGDLPDEITAAATALVATRVGHNVEQLGAAVRGLLPNRHALATLTQVLGAWMWWTPDAAPAARAMLDAMAPDPLTVGLQIQIALGGLPAAEVAHVLAEMARKDVLHADALASAVVLFQGRGWRRPPQVLEGIVSALANSEEGALRRLSLAGLIGLAGASGGWSEARLAQLYRFRSDPCALVAEAAQFTFVAAEA
jgi:hypothetical protein